ncbi:acyltransferase family protein [Limimaricola sp.]|uniref:acyltransferase family protein n=1 Tax=Limimaricola sp. TaxID=2211665 RepID=UPI004058E6FF
MTGRTVAKLGYRPEIDGLRCLAVVPVLLFHAGLPPFSGGYVGVDVFFVISGYLIATILFEDLAAGRFSIARFYERRARRILPALFVVVLACLPFGWTWMLLREFKEFLQSVAATALSVSNVYFWLKSDYFALEAELLPLLHSWSLGVEEQFYMLFPGLLLLLHGQPGRRQIGALLAIGAASFAAGLWYISTHPMMVYYLLPFRAWELIAGAACAYLHHRHGRWPNGWLALAGAGLVLYAMLAYDAHTVFPGWAAVPPVLGSALIILYADPGALLGRVLALRPVVFVGLISYSLYLWHQPVLAFARHYLGHEPAAPVLVALLLLCVLLAVLTWHFVEKPFRRRGPLALLPRRKHVYAWSAASIVAVTGIGVAGDLRAGFPGRLSDWEMRVYVESGWYSDCMYTRDAPAPAPPDAGCVVNPGQPRKAALFGDSVMSSLAPSFARSLAARGYEVHLLTHSHCTLNLDYRRASQNAQPCPDFARSMLDFIEAERFDLVVTAGHFAALLGGAPGQVVEAASGAPVTEAGPILQDLNRQLTSLPGEVVLVLPYPTPESGVRQSTLKQLRVTGELAQTAIERADLADTADRVGALLRSTITQENIRFLDPTAALCDAERCRFVQGGMPLLSDTLHFTAAGADLVAAQLETLLAARGRAVPVDFAAPAPVVR